MAANEQDTAIGRNLAKLRQQVDLTQEQVADAMRNEYGYKWSKATVWSIETGSRPLKLAEAQDVLKALKLDWKTYLPLLLGDGEYTPESRVETRGKELLARFDRLFNYEIPELAESYLDFLVYASTLYGGTENDKVRKTAKKYLEKCNPNIFTTVFWEEVRIGILKEYCGSSGEDDAYWKNDVTDAMREALQNSTSNFPLLLRYLLDDTWRDYLPPVQNKR